MPGDRDVGGVRISSAPGNPHPQEGTPMSVRHGTVAGYQHHSCRCDPCTRAKRLYQRELRAGVRRPLVDATATREHLLALKASGWSWAGLGRALGYHHTVLIAIADGTRQRVRQSTAEDIASLPVGEAAA